jgi:PAS domain S-box-containing protein
MSVIPTADPSLLDDIIAGIGTALVVVDDSGKIILGNDAAEALLGRSPEDLPESRLEELIAGGPDPPMTVVRDAARSEGHAVASEDGLSLVHADGHPIPVALEATRLKRPETDYFVLTLSRAERSRERTPPALSESSEFPAGAFEASNDGLVVIDPATDQVLECNPRACELLGCRREEVRSRPASAVLGHPPEELVGLAETGDRLTVGLDDGPSDRPSIAEVTSSLLTAHQRRYVLVHLRDITGRRDRATSLERRSEAMDAAFDGIAILDDDWQFVYMNPAHATVYGYDSPADIVGRSWTQLYGPDEIKRFRREVLPAVREQGDWHGEATGRRHDSTEFPQELSISRLEDGGYVCVVRDVSDRQERTRRLRRLNEGSRDLSKATTTAEIARIGTETAEQLLETNVTCVRLFDPETGSLEPAAMSDGAAALVDSRPAFDLNASLAGRAYRAGEPVVDRPESTDTSAADAEENVHLPLGDHGTLTAFVIGDRSLSEMDLRLLEALAETIEADLDRASREQELRESEHTVREQRDRLQSLNRVNELVQDLIRELIEAPTREKLERRVCERLAATDRYRGAWLAETDVNGDWKLLKTSAGLSEDYRTLIQRLPVEQIDDGVVARAADAGELSVTSDYRVDGSAEPAEIEEEVQVDATAAVPLAYDGRLYGVLVLKADEPDAFEAEIASGLEVLGDSIGFAIHAVENRRLLLSDETVELEFEVTDERCLAVAVSDQLGCYAAIEQAVLTSDGNHLCYLRVEGATPDAALAATVDAPAVADSRVIEKSEDGCLLEVCKTESGAEGMMNVGATLRTATAEDGVGTLVVQAPPSADIREVIDSYTARNPASSLRAKREVDRPVRTAATVRERLDEQLTEKQESALTAAYYAGYYDWPRRSTAEELADSLEIASATLHQHLRKAEGKLLTALIDDDDEPTRADAPPVR